MDDLPGHIDSSITNPDTLMLAVHHCGASEWVIRHALTWDPEHPRHAAVMEVLRTPALEPFEIGWRAARDAVDPYALTNALHSQRHHPR